METACLKHQVSEALWLQKSVSCQNYDHHVQQVHHLRKITNLSPSHSSNAVLGNSPSTVVSINRKYFPVQHCIPTSSFPKTCPVLCIQCYMYTCDMMPNKGWSKDDGCSTLFYFSFSSISMCRYSILLMNIPDIMLDSLSAADLCLLREREGEEGLWSLWMRKENRVDFLKVAAAFLARV